MDLLRRKIVQKVARKLGSTTASLSFRKEREYRQMSVEELKLAWEERQEATDAFYDDPMTDAIGAPTDDFQRDFDVEERFILAQIMDKADSDSADWQWAWDRYEKFTP